MGFRSPKSPPMAFLEQPPMPRSAQRMIWLARAISSVGLVIGVYVGAYWASQGETVLAFLTLAIAVAYVLSTWINPMSPGFGFRLVPFPQCWLCSTPV